MITPIPHSRCRHPAALAFGLVLACGLGLDVEPALAGHGSWIQKQRLPKALAGPGACEVDGILYLAGGETFWGHVVPTLLAYDPKTDAWTPKTDMPTARGIPSAGAVDGIIYVIGGGNLADRSVTGVVEAYDPKTDTWTTKNSMPTARAAADACTLDGLIYVIGGVDEGLASIATVECYDPKTDRWTRKQGLPEVASAPVLQVVNGTIYSFYDQSTFAYDPNADRWSRRARIPGSLPSINGMAGTVEGVIHLFGGVSATLLCAHDLALAYDPVQDRFTSGPALPAALVIAGSATIDGKIYLAGGATGHPVICPTARYSDSLWVFDPQDHPGSWASKANMPIAVAGAAAAELDRVLYVAGGDCLASPHVTNAFFAYRLDTDSWTRKADMPTARVAADAVAVDGIVCVMGGGDIRAEVVTRVVEAYDPKTETWTTRTPMPAARLCPTCCTLKGLVYVIGGYDANGSRSDALECYDPKTDRWTRKRSLPSPTGGQAAQVVGNKLYVFDENSTFAYDPTADVWTRKASFPAGFRCYHTAAGTVNGLIYLLGGLGQDGTHAHALSLAYDPAQDRFTGRRMVPVPCGEAAAVTVDGKIYLAGGFSGNPFAGSGAVYYNSLRVFDPQGGVYPRILSLSRPSSDTVRLAWQGEAGRRYGVESAFGSIHGTWTRLRFPDGSLTIQPVDTSVETTLTVPPTAGARYFRVVEAD